MLDAITRRVEGVPSEASESEQHPLLLPLLILPLRSPGFFLLDEGSL